MQSIMLQDQKQLQWRWWMLHQLHQILQLDQVHQDHRARLHQRLWLCQMQVCQSCHLLYLGSLICLQKYLISGTGRSHSIGPGPPVGGPPVVVIIGAARKGKPPLEARRSEFGH